MATDRPIILSQCYAVEAREEFMKITLREEIHALAEQLPEDATWADVLERLRFRAGVEAGHGAADRGEFASEADVRRVFGKYGAGS